MERKKNLTAEEWILKLTELAEIVKFTAFVRDNGLDKFIKDWKTLMEFL